jgi:DNA polymerase III alpha subunit
MAAFAGYGFPKAHAASYAMVAWRSAWCKTYYPAEFMAAVLANWGGYYSQRVYISEARRMGLHLHAPHINHSQREFRVAYINGEPELYMGLDQVRDLTRRAQERILQRRPFHSVEEFLVRVDPRPQEAENLARVGAFENLGSIPEVLEQIKEGWRPGQMSLFQASKTYQEDWSLEQKMSAQEALLGTSVVAHPLELFSAQINAAGVVTTLEAAAHPGRRVRVAGVRQTLRRAAARSQSGRSQTMAFLSLEDLEGTLDVVIFPDVYQKSRQLLSGTRPLLVEGSLEYDAESSEPVLQAERIALLT